MLSRAPTEYINHKIRRIPSSQQLRPVPPPEQSPRRRLLVLPRALRPSLHPKIVRIFNRIDGLSDGPPVFHTPPSPSAPSPSSASGTGKARTGKGAFPCPHSFLTLRTPGVLLQKRSRGRTPFPLHHEYLSRVRVDAAPVLDVMRLPFVTTVLPARGTILLPVQTPDAPLPAGTTEIPPPRQSGRNGPNGDERRPEIHTIGQSHRTTAPFVASVRDDVSVLETDTHHPCQPEFIQKKSQNKHCQTPQDRRHHLGNFFFLAKMTPPQPSPRPKLTTPKLRTIPIPSKKRETNEADLTDTYHDTRHLSVLRRLSHHITEMPSHKITNRGSELRDPNHFFHLVRVPQRKRNAPFKKR